jgi:hypothetical protein
MVPGIEKLMWLCSGGEVGTDCLWIVKEAFSLMDKGTTMPSSNRIEADVEMW